MLKRSEAEEYYTFILNNSHRMTSRYPLIEKIKILKFLLKTNRLLQFENILKYFYNQVVFYNTYPNIPKSCKCVTDYESTVATFKDSFYLSNRRMFGNFKNSRRAYNSTVPEGFFKNGLLHGSTARISNVNSGQRYSSIFYIAGEVVPIHNLRYL
jgi:hypothetical protein